MTRWHELPTTQRGAPRTRLSSASATSSAARGARSAPRPVTARIGGTVGTASNCCANCASPNGRSSGGSASPRHRRQRHRHRRDQVARDPWSHGCTPSRFSVAFTLRAIAALSIPILRESATRRSHHDLSVRAGRRFDPRALIRGTKRWRGRLVVDSKGRIALHPYHPSARRAYRPAVLP